MTYPFEVRGAYFQDARTGHWYGSGFRRKGCDCRVWREPLMRRRYFLRELEIAADAGYEAVWMRSRYVGLICPVCVARYAPRPPKTPEELQEQKLDRQIRALEREMSRPGYNQRGLNGGT